MWVSTMRLTEEEHLILIEYSHGYTLQEIANRKDLSLDQVRTRMRNTRMKLGGKSYPHCIRLGFEQRLLV